MSRSRRPGLIVYASGFVHRVTPITSGSRLVAVSWIQSQIRDPEKRALVYKLDCAIAALEAADIDRGELLRLKQVHNDLMRQWLDI